MSRTFKTHYNKLIYSGVEPNYRKTPQDETFDILDFFNTNQVKLKNTSIYRPTFITTYKQQPENKHLIALRPTILNFNEHMTNFVSKYRKELVDEAGKNMYTHYKIPKKNNRGFRLISEPFPELKEMQNRIKDFIENVLHVLPHDAAYAYVKQRSVKSNAERHRGNHYFLHIDLHNFFPSIRQHSLFQALSIHDFAKYVPRSFLENIATIASFNDGLPQGSPLSPLLSNLYMVAFDYDINLYLRRSLKGIVYTRYADDLVFSSKHPIQIHEIVDIIERFGKLAPYNLTINEDKLSYIQNSNKYFITGVTINQDNKLSIGHATKKELKHQIHQVLIKKETNTLTIEEAQTVIGRLAWLQNIEPEYGKYVEKTYLRKFNSPFQTLGKHLLHNLPN